MHYSTGHLLPGKQNMTSYCDVTTLHGGEVTSDGIEEASATSGRSLQGTILPAGYDGYVRLPAGGRARQSLWQNRVYRQGLFSSAMTLCLSIMGGAVFPVPWAFSVTGAAAGTLICLTVAAANVFTSDLLIQQCYRTGTRDYEELAFAIGGHPWLAVTRVSILVLLLGSMISPIRQAAEAAVFALEAVVAPSQLPAWLIYRDGAGFVFMAAFVAFIIFPLCLYKELRSMEHVGVVGFVIILFLVAAVALQSLAAGLPALRSGDFSPTGFESMGSLSQAVSVLGYAFFIQPLMMPLLNEMPGPPEVQTRILSWAMRFAVLVFACVAYVLVGFFGASLFGHSTKGNFLQNQILGGGWGQISTNLLMTLYICLSVPPVEFCIRRILTNWAFGSPDCGFLHHAIFTSSILGVSLSAAMFWHGGSESMLAVTGATGVLMTAYVCPVANHFLLYFGLSFSELHQKKEGVMEGARDGLPQNSPDAHLLKKNSTEEGSLVGGNESFQASRLNTFSQTARTLWNMFWDFLLPLSIVALGACCSFITMYS